MKQPIKTYLHSEHMRRHLGNGHFYAEKLYGAYYLGFETPEGHSAVGIDETLYNAFLEQAEVFKEKMANCCVGSTPERYQMWFWCPRCREAVPQLSPAHLKAYCPCVGSNKAQDESPEASMILLSATEPQICQHLRKIGRL